MFKNYPDVSNKHSDFIGNHNFKSTVQNSIKHTAYSAVNLDKRGVRPAHPNSQNTAVKN